MNSIPYLDHPIESPVVRGIERVAREHLIGDEQGKRHDEPGNDFPNKCTDLVNGKQQFLHGLHLILKISHPDD